MKSRKKMILTGVLLLIMIVAVSGSIAFYTSEDSAINKFIAGDSDIKIEEEFEEGDWDGDLRVKKVQIANNSYSDSLVRVSITPRWVNEDGSPFSGDTSSKTISLNFSKNLKNSIDDVNILASEGQWFKGQDGYYYYMKKLEGKINEENKSLTSILLESVSLADGIVLGDEYKGKTLKVDVKAETVQATNHDEDNDGENEYQFEKVWLNVDKEISNKLKEILDK